MKDFLERYSSKDSLYASETCRSFSYICSSMIDGIKIVAFDADDTLWMNEPLFRQAERQVADALSEFGSFEYISDELYKVEFKNMPDYGFGAKAYMLSMVENALNISGGRLSESQVRTILDDNSNVSAMLMTTNANCIISGDLSLINEGKLTLSELRSEIVASPGEKVVTSNISSKYLPGILIGYIDTISDDTNHLTKTGYLIPAVDFEDIRNVFVILKVKETGN